MPQEDGKLSRCRSTQKLQMVLLFTDCREVMTLCPVKSKGPFQRRKAFHVISLLRGPFFLIPCCYTETKTTESDGSGRIQGRRDDQTWNGPFLRSQTLFPGPFLLSSICFGRSGKRESASFGFPFALSLSGMISFSAPCVLHLQCPKRLCRASTCGKDFRKVFREHFPILMCSIRNSVKSFYEDLYSERRQ